MLTREQALEAICGVRESQPQHVKPLSAAVEDMHRAIHESRQSLFDGNQTRALHAIAAVAAHALGALEQHGSDAREQAQGN